MDKDNEIELVQTIQEKDKRIKELEEKVKELEYMYENTKRELITRTNKYIELLEKLKDSVPKDKIGEKLLAITDLKSKIDLSKEKTPLEFYVLDYANNLLVELLEEE